MEKIRLFGFVVYSVVVVVIFFLMWKRFFFLSSCFHYMGLMHWPIVDSNGVYMTIVIVQMANENAFTL